MKKLRTNHITVLYENGALRQIKLGDTEILRMIYSAVRDRNWDTIEPKIEDELLEIGENSFDIKLKVCYQTNPIHFVAEYQISGEKNKIRFEMTGTAQSDFLKNRIGFCVLHPIRECAGKTATAIHSDGSTSEFLFPEYISPNQPVKNVRAMIWEAAPGITARMSFSGDIFEMEDQRNWTDASFKTYCTPLELPFPAEIRKGDTVLQVVELTIETEKNQKSPVNDFVFSWSDERISKLPELGTAISSRKETLTHGEIDLLGNLPFQHLRVEVKMNHPDFADVFGKAMREGKLLGWPLFVVLYLSENHSNEYQKFASFCRELNVKVSYLLMVGPNHLPFAEFDELSAQIRNDFPEILIGTGVNAYFAELNRTRPAIEKADFVSFTICPQVHVSDSATLVENLEAQAEVVSSAHVLFPGKPIYISPVSLKQRFNVVAITAEPEPEPGTLPSSVDPRQRTAFAAVWTLGSLKFLSQSGCRLISYYETVDWKGFIQGEFNPDCPEKFHAKANDIFPIYEAIKELSGFSQVIHSHSSHPLLFDGLVVKSELETKLFIFSFSTEELVVTLNTGLQPKEIRSLLYSTNPELSRDQLTLQAWDLMVIKFNT
ncbi:MAG TPA: hypothetical protein DCR40_00325 [Prolixibacteraceae bacterium]|nr:hypothetical protein [Prolixibacteraceae bacterium]